MTEYVLTSLVKKRLETLGFILSCYRCGEPLLLGDRVISKYGGGLKVKKLYHKHCWENQSAEEAVSPKLTRNRQPIPIWGKPKQPAYHIRLVKGVFSSNPGKVLCPTLSSYGKCNKHDRDFKVYRPRLLLRNYSNPSLELWECKGCKDFLLRVDRNA